MIRLVALALSFACFALAAIGFASVLSSTACIVGGDAGPGGGATSLYSYTNCPGGLPSAPACLECLASSCGTQVDTINSVCASYLACLCPAGANAQMCGAEGDDAGAPLLTSTCSQALDAVFDCAETNCFDQCQPDAG